MKFRKIMLVDDDSDDQELFSLALRRIEDTILHEMASNGKEALKKLESMSEHPEVVFMDLNMPLMNGLEALRTMKASQALKDIPVIIFTTTADNGTIEEIRALGAYKFFPKPVKFEYLQKLLAQVLDGNFADFTVK